MEQQKVFESVGIFPNDTDTYKSLAILNEQEIEHRIKEIKLNEDLASYNPGMEAEQLQVYVVTDQKDIAYQLLLKTGLFSEEEAEDDPNMFASYSDEELIEVVKNRDEWGIAFVSQAEAILQERGITISEEEKQQLENIRYQELDDQETPTNPLSTQLLTLSIGGLLLSIAIFYFVFEITAWPTVGTCAFSAWWGWVFATRKRTNIKGEEYYLYTEETRKNGKYLMYACFIALPLALLLSLLTDKW